MNNNLLQVLLAAIRARITPIVTKFRLWTNWNYIKTRVVTKVREFFVKLFDVKPRHKKDYYEMFGWMVSKKLAFAIVVVVGVLSLYYLAKTQVTSFGFGRQANETRTYSYNSLMLRFANGTVRIKGKSGYLAYEGNVSKGAANGNGRLYNPEGTLVYTGQFENSKYEGNGSQYYDTGVMHYQGHFSNNLYEETGKLYYENGSPAYSGSFSKGMKDGEGTLYNRNGNRIYEGDFSADEIVYSALLGKSTQDVSQSYKGSRMLYESDDEFTVVMQDIDAAYVGNANANALADDMKVEQVYVLKNSFSIGGNTYTSTEELKEYFGQPEYEGNSDITMTEAICLNYEKSIAALKDVDVSEVDMDYDVVYDDYFVIKDYDAGYSVYLYSFRKDGLLYTFVCPDRDKPFLFYFIMSEEGGAS